MNKDEYQISRKSDFICFNILLHDLCCFNKELLEPITDPESLVNKLRNTRNVFVSLHNLKDSMNRIKVTGDEKFIYEGRSLRKKLEFIVHIRNKGVGHLNRILLERSAQWCPELFHENSYDNKEYLVYLSYKSVLESTINSYLNEEGIQKVFKTEIDFEYPPDAEKFFKFLSDIVKQSILWIENASSIVKSEIKFHNDEKRNEMGAIAAKTNFNLKEDSDLTFDENKMRKRVTSVVDKLKQMDTDQEIIDYIEKKLF